jgi:hypothetical protein
MFELQLFHEIQLVMHPLGFSDINETESCVNFATNLRDCVK